MTTTLAETTSHPTTAAPAPQPSPRRRRVVLIACAWLCALLLAFALDRLTVTLIRDRFPLQPFRGTLRALWWLGNAGTLAGLAVVVTLVHRWRWRAGLFVLTGGAVAGLLYVVLKWVAGRRRPFKGYDAFDFALFEGGWRGLIIGVPNATFPSGHASLVFAAAACLHRLYPRAAWLFYTLAGLVAVARVLRGAHYPSDVVAGAAVGVLATNLAWMLLARLSIVKRSESAPVAERQTLRT